MLTHHASNSCNLRPGDLFASGTVSGPEKESRDCLLELTSRGKEPPHAADRRGEGASADGDEVDSAGAVRARGVPFDRLRGGRGLVQPALRKELTDNRASCRSRQSSSSCRTSSEQWYVVGRMLEFFPVCSAILALACYVGSKWWPLFLVKYVLLLAFFGCCSAACRSTTRADRAMGRFGFGLDSRVARQRHQVPSSTAAGAVVTWERFSPLPGETRAGPSLCSDSVA